MNKLNNFIRKNNLSARWRQLSGNQSVFTVGEIEFKLGENFFSCVELWKKIVKSGPRLHFLAGVQRPIPIDYVNKLINTNRLSTDSAKYLMSHFPKNLEGLHTLYFLDGQIRLSLLLGQSQKLFEELCNDSDPSFNGLQRPTVDAWFVREYKSSNKQLWSTIARLSSTETSFVVVTEASDSTQTHLVKAGFEFDVDEECAAKYSIISGHYATVRAPTLMTDRVLHWQIDKNRKNRTTSKEVTVLGAGLAGCLSASALEKRGYKVSLIDRHALPAGEASGHHHSILYPKLSIETEPVPRINFHAILYASAYYQPFWKNKIGKKCGIILLPRTEIEEKQYRVISEYTKDHEKFVRFLPSKELEAIAGVKLTSNGGLFFANLGWLPTIEVCRKLIAQSNIRLIQSDIENIVYNDKNESWSLFDRKGSNIKQSPILVLACSYGCQQFAQTQYLPIKKVRGQISYLPVTNASKKLNTIVCGHGYLSPAHDNIHCCGATYNNDNGEKLIRTTDNQRNLDTITKTDFELGKLFKGMSAKHLAGWAHFRCTTSDYLPIVGQVPDIKRMVSDFHALRSNARASIAAKGSYLKNLYINCGLGSRGLTYAPLAAEILASDIANEFPPLGADLRLAMHPARFIIRDLKKRKL